jgi:hypothetical protein
MTITKSPIRLAAYEALQIAVEHGGGMGVGNAAATTYASNSPTTVSEYPSRSRLRSNSTPKENRAHGLIVRPPLLRSNQSLPG